MNCKCIERFQIILKRFATNDRSDETLIRLDQQTTMLRQSRWYEFEFKLKFHTSLHKKTLNYVSQFFWFHSVHVLLKLLSDSFI